MKKIILTLISSLVLFSCGKSFDKTGSGAGTDSQPTVSGYNNTGTFVQAKAQSPNEGCPAIGNQFTQACFNAGFQISYDENCNDLCSGKIVCQMSSQNNVTTCTQAQ